MEDSPNYEDIISEMLANRKRLKVIRTARETRLSQNRKCVGRIETVYRHVKMT